MGFHGNNRIITPYSAPLTFIDRYILFDYTTTNSFYFGSTPVIAQDGTIYIGYGSYSSSPGIYALAPNGTVKWIYSCDEYIAFPNTPIIGSNDHLYFSSIHNVYSVDPQGTLVWKTYITHEIIAIRFLRGGILVYTKNELIKLYASGTIQWTTTLESASDTRYQIPAIDSLDNIYVNINRSFPNEVSQLFKYSGTGHLLWSQSSVITPVNAGSSPVLNKTQTLVFISSNTGIQGYLTSTGEPFWTTGPRYGNSYTLASFYGYFSPYTTSITIDDDDNIIVALNYGSSSRLVMYNINTYSPTLNDSVFDISLNNINLQTTPVIDHNNNIIVTGMHSIFVNFVPIWSSYVYLYDRQGDQLWSQQLAQSASTMITSLPIVGTNNEILISTFSYDPASNFSYSDIFIIYSDT
jgi:hypothetical protein